LTLADIIEHLQTATGSNEAPEILHQQTSDNENACIIRQPLTISSLGTCTADVKIKESDVCIIISDGTGLADELAEQLNCDCKILQAGEKIACKELDILLICAHQIQSQEDILNGFASIQQALPLLKDSRGRFIAVTQLGGQFAIDEQCPVNVLSAAWLGMVKTAAQEYPDINCKIIDNENDYKIDAIIDEMQNFDDIEVALHGGKRWTPKLLDNQAIQQTHIELLNENDSIIISGGARGVTAEVAVALAKNFKVKLALLGRSPLPEEEAAYLIDAQDEAAVKKALISNWSEGSTTPKPKEIAQAATRILAHREIRNNIKRMQAYGSEVGYYSVDVCDAQAVNTCCETVRKAHGSISGIIHGAGVLADKFIVDKSAEQFSQVLSTKIDGAFNLIHACENDKLKCIVFFSSSTARFGRTGQIDYAAANEILNKLAQRERHNRMNSKVLSINWGPWDGGMVTPALKELFAKEGVGVIDLQLGAQYLCDELCNEDPYTEIVILGDVDINAGFPIESAQEGQRSDTHVVYDRELSVASHAFLRSHVINSKAVLPMAIMIEWMTHAAMHDNPGMVFFGLEDLRVFKGIIIDESEKYVLEFKAGDAQWNNGQATIDVEIVHGDTLHARARIHLTDSLGSDSPSAQAQPHGAAPAGNPYQDKRLFHGIDLQGLQNVETCDEKGIVAWSSIAPDAGQWINKPLRTKWYADPMVLDVAFQCMIVWSHQQHGCASLPTRAGSYQQFQNDFSNNGSADKCKIIARIISSSKHSARANIEFIDVKGNLIARILDYECVIDPSLDATFARNTLTAEINS
ncbi:MAG: SDR family oxidoreductase, partial [Planctomycetes bacterium]|nr:SDR family oxidoreductase [Planctomycetota bacterium]